MSMRALATDRGGTAAEETARWRRHAAPSYHRAMVDADYCRLLARYNRWMNERLYALVAQMDPV